MKQAALELYLYLEDSQSIIDWLKTEGIKTKEEAKHKLQPILQSNTLSCLSYINQGKGRDVARRHRSISLKSSSNCLNKVLGYFPESL